LWRGPPLGDVSGEPFAAAAIRRLEELRFAAFELAIDADLEAGRHCEVLGELDALVAEEPLRERLQAQRMLALYRSGRQADALEAYREARRRERPQAAGIADHGRPRHVRVRRADAGRYPSVRRIH
jgi:DNA-binding SARP family transcriptional activator